MEPEDLFRMHFLTGVDLSPDGKWAAYTVLSTDVEEDEDRVAMCFMGDAAVNQGALHESLNMAAIWKLPVIFVVENNQYASTTPKSDSCAVGDLCMRAAGYGMPGEKVDGNDLLAVRKAAAVAIERARAGEGPTLPVVWRSMA